MYMAFLNIFTLLLASVSVRAVPGSNGPPLHGARYGEHGSGNHTWDLKKFSTHVVFGDSYSDDSRFAYFASHNGSAPPPGWVNPPNPAAADGGFSWPDYVRWYSGARLHNYAVSGAACSNSITPRYLPLIKGDYPDVEHYEVPAYIADSQYVQPNGTKFFVAPPDETVYSMWIGTNDLDVGALLTDSQVPGTDVTTYLDCVYTQLQRIYDNGARYFVLHNLIPLQLTPLVATPENGGVGPNHYWPQKPSNGTAISYKMLEMVVTANMIYKYRTPFEVVLAKRFPGAQFALMDMYGLVGLPCQLNPLRADGSQILDIWKNPAEYLNGTAPANSTAFILQCPIDAVGYDQCSQRPSPDSYLWFDESHPSEQTDRIIARTFIDVVKGASKWATYWSG